MNRPGDRKRVVALFLVAAAAVLAMLLPGLRGGHAVSAASTSMIGIDVQPETNTPASLGTLETCASHDVGDSFPVDIFVNNVANLRAWELRLDYDESVVHIASIDFARFLVSTQPAGNLFPTLQEAEAPGRDFLAAAELSGGADSGSGVLARLTLEAVSKGESQLSIVKSPSAAGPRLSASEGVPVGDSNGDGIWDDTITSGKVVVGSDCNSSPVITPKPSPKPTPTLRPGETPLPTATPGGAGPIGTTAPGDEPGATGEPDVIHIPGASDTPAPNDPNSSDGNGTGNGGSNPGSGSQDGNNGGNGNGGLTRSSTSSGSSSIWLIIGGLAAAAFVAGGGLLYMFSRRTSI